MLKVVLIKNVKLFEMKFYNSFSGGSLKVLRNQIYYLLKYKISSHIWKTIKIVLYCQVSAHYTADPYKMLDQLKKMNLKHVKVAYGEQKKKKSTPSTSVKLWMWSHDSLCVPVFR